MTVDAASREEAVAKLKAMMTPDAVNQHFAQKHTDQPVPPYDAVMAMLDQGVMEGDMSTGSDGGSSPSAAM